MKATKDFCYELIEKEQERVSATFRISQPQILANKKLFIFSSYISVGGLLFHGHLEII